MYFHRSCCYEFAGGFSYQFAIDGNAQGRFAYVQRSRTGEITVADGTLLDCESNTSHDVTVREPMKKVLAYDEVIYKDVFNFTEILQND